jgi:uncharacterized protein YjbI with pentapeptide repeats
MSKITIFHINGSEIFTHECEGNTIKRTVEEAVKQGASLAYADLKGESLNYAKLDHANLYGASLNGVKMNGVKLNYAKLDHADLYEANLNYAELNGASLYNSNLHCANLYRARLNGANLEGEVLSSKTPISLYINKQFILITDNYMRFGCQLYTHSEWENFSDEETSRMFDGTSEFWRCWGNVLIRMCKVHTNLHCTNLYHARLNHTFFDGTNLSSKAPISITNLKWSVIVTEKHMQIGCQRHTHSEWENFSDEEISKMDDSAGEFWKQWKIGLIEMCKVHAKS